MIGMIAGAAAGYVLGSRAGRERYEQIKRASRKIADNPAVQSAVGTVKDQVGQLVAKGRQAITGSTGRHGDTIG